MTNNYYVDENAARDAIFNLEEQEKDGIYNAQPVSYQQLVEEGYAPNVSSDTPQQQIINKETYEAAGKPDKQETLPYPEEGMEQYSSLSFGEKLQEGYGSEIQGIYEGVDAGLFGLLPDKKIYKPRTKVGKTLEVAWKYPIAAASFLLPVGWAGKGVGAIGKTIQGTKAAKNITAVAKSSDVLNKAGKVLQGGTKVFKGESWQAKLGNAVLDPRNVLAGSLADYYAYDPEEGHLADLLATYPQFQNPLVNFLEADPDDTVAEARLKNVIEGAILAPFAGLIGHGVGPMAETVTRMFKNEKALTKAAIEGNVKTANEAAQNLLNDKSTLRKATESADLANAAQDAINRSVDEGIDPHEIIRENLPVTKYKEADEIIEAMRKGETVGLQPDGTLAITVNNWEDAYKVTRHQMRGQTNNAIEDMNKYLADRWGQYGDEAGNLNTEVLVSDYKQKWGIPEDTKINVQYVDSTAKDLKGREGVTISRGKNNNNITIKINKDSPNQYTVLRSELEHARDYALNQKPTKNHFSRYDVQNESEFASDYLYKKSVSKAIRENKPINSKILDDYTNFQNTLTNKPYESRQLSIFEQNLNTINKSKNTIEIKEQQLKEQLSQHIPETREELSTLRDVAYQSYRRDWKAYTESGENLYQSILKNADDLDMDTEALANQLPLMTGEQLLTANDSILAGGKLSGLLHDQVREAQKALKQNPNDVDSLIKVNKLQNALFTLAKNDYEWGSALGLALSERRLSNKILESYKEEGLTALQKQGINDLSDFLTEEYFKTDKSYFTTDGFVEQTLAKLKDIEKFNIDDLSPERLEAFTSYIHKNLPQDLDETAQRAWIKDKFNIFASADFDTAYAEAAESAIHPKGFVAFQKYAFNNLRTLQINGLLSAPPTHITNGLSGITNALLNPFTKLVAGKMFNDKVLTDAAADMLTGYMRSWKESLELGLKVFKSEDTYDSTADLQGLLKNDSEPLPLSAESFGISQASPFRAFFDAVGKGLRFPTRIMGTMDTVMTQLNYRALAFAEAMGEARALLAKEGITNTDEILAAAEKLFKTEGKYFTKTGEAVSPDLLYEAKEMLYQNSLDGAIRIGREKTQIDSELSVVRKLGNLVNKGTQVIPALRLVLPFINTPFNLLNQAVEYSPLAIQRALSTKLSDRERKIASAKIAIGCSVWGLGIMMAMSGKITGTTPTGEQGKASHKTGWQPNSIVFTKPDGTKTYLSYARYEPLASMLSMGADLASMAEAMSTNDATIITNRILGSIAQNFTNKVYFKTMLDQLNLVLADDVDAFKKAGNVGARFLQGFVPYSGALRWGNSLADPELKQARGFLEDIRKGLPFVDGVGNPIEPKRNFYGEIMYSQDNFFNNLFGVRSNSQQATVEDLELIRLADQGYAPPMLNPQYKDKEMDLLNFRDPETKQTAYDAVAQRMGEITINGLTLRGALAELIQSPEYQNMVDGISEREDQALISKKKALNDIFNTYKTEALAEIIQSEHFINVQGQSLNQVQQAWQESRYMDYTSQQSEDDSITELNEDLNDLTY